MSHDFSVPQDLFGVSIMLPLLPNFMQRLGATPSVAGLIGEPYGLELML